MKSMPQHLEQYKDTPLFTQDTVPTGLLRNHKTKTGVWAKIIITQGLLQYTIDGEAPVTLSTTHVGIIEPDVLHAIKPLGDVSFYISFYR